MTLVALAGKRYPVRSGERPEDFRALTAFSRRDAVVRLVVMISAFEFTSAIFVNAGGVTALIGFGVLRASRHISYGDAGRLVADLDRSAASTLRSRDRWRQRDHETTVCSG